ncbi:MAG: hypothetical protein JJU28_00570 [Cyclobacteriaceae bacterium]|nr:hypothetical protein [Cyclobacteriaceae bacterium]
MATSSEELAGQAEQLLDLVSFFKLDNNSSRNTKKAGAQKQKALSSRTTTGTFMKPGNGQTHAGANGGQKKGKTGTGFNLVLDDNDTEFEKF